MEAPKFPPKQIVKVIMEETQSKFNNFRKEAKNIPLAYDEEFHEMCRQHLEDMRKLETYEEIGSWLSIYRRISLGEWVSSL